ncbi:lysoplasmalogenase [Flagellimonas sp. S3867]|uniref:lysoplasmalogenase n=1 Tax=Flagellimonas sp. S3867 TaxID=2768063 RepID=UPI0016851EFB|nr:lysoplasmalogenase [Flagellimonas sp. S3867]
MEKARSRKAINILSLISAVAAMLFDFFDNTLLFSIFKPLTTILILSLLFFVQNEQLSKFRNIIIAALVFCLIGDVFLLKEEYFVFGLGAFLIGHVLFATGFINLEGFNFHWISFLILAGIGGGLFIWLQPDLGSFALPVGIYVIVIIFMAWQGMSLNFHNPNKVYRLIGAAVLLFMFSDTMIAINKFKFPVKFSGLLILSTYWLSISLIANAAYFILDRRKSV